jgi:hypothetical protein
MAIIGRANGENERMERVGVDIPYSNTNMAMTDPEILLNGGKISYNKDLCKEYIINQRMINIIIIKQ